MGAAADSEVRKPLKLCVNNVVNRGYTDRLARWNGHMAELQVGSCLNRCGDCRLSVVYEYDGLGGTAESAEELERWIGTQP